MKVVGADETAVTHIDQRALDGGHTAAPCHRKLAFVRRAVAAGEHGFRFIDGNKQQFVLVRHDDIAVKQITQLARLQRAGAHLGHGGCRETFRQERHDILAGRRSGVFRRTPCDVGQATGAGNQPHAHFHQTDIALHRRDALGGVHRHFATTAQGQATDGRDGGHIGVTQFEHHALQFSRSAINGLGATHHEGWQHGLQVCTGGEHLVGRPDDQTLVVLFGHVDRFVQAFDDTGADSVHLGLDAGDDDFVIQRPQANGFVFMQRLACRGSSRRIGTQHALGKVLAGVHRQAARCNELASRRVPRSCGSVHAARVGNGALEHPVWQWRLAQCPPGINIFLHHVGHFQPTGFLPKFERALLHAKAPAHTEVDITGVVGNAGKVHSAVVECVAQNGPQKLALRALRIAQ